MVRRHMRLVYVCDNCGAYGQADYSMRFSGACDALVAVPHMPDGWVSVGSKALCPKTCCAGKFEAFMQMKYEASSKEVQ